MKTAGEILKDLIADLIAATNKITYFGKDGVARGMLHAVAHALSELWNSLYQTKRKIFVETAEGADLDLIATRHGLTRRTATKASVVLIFNGLDDTVIPANTIVRSNLSSEQFETKAAITLGDQNPSIERPVTANTLADIVIAESINTGSKTQVNVKELTQLQVPIAGVSVTNLVPSKGGLDAEADDQLRSRIMSRIAILNQGTQAFYEALAQEAEATVFRAKAAYSPNDLGVKLYLIKDSFGTYTGPELTAIASAVYDKARALSPVTCENASIKSVEILFSYERNSAVTQATIFSSIASSIANYIESVFDFAAKVEYQQILNIIIDTPGVTKLYVNTLKVNGMQDDVLCSTYQVPRFTLLGINDGTGLQNIIFQENVIY